MRKWMRDHSRETRALVEPRALVHVLRTDEELHAAAERAIESERDAISRSRELINFYEQLEPGGAILSMPSPASDKTGGVEHEVRSA
jgi:hypothetical protein